MPTFHSIRTHPLVIQRLQQPQPQPQPQQPYPTTTPIWTPLALLARPSETLQRALSTTTIPGTSTSTSTTMDIEHIHRLKRQIAIALLNGGLEEEEEVDTTITTTKKATPPRPWKGLPSISLWDQVQQQYQYQYPSSYVSTNCLPLDRMLQFPTQWIEESDAITTTTILPPGNMLSIVGKPGVGKTQLALQMALYTANYYNQQQQQQQQQPPSSTTTTTLGMVRYFVTSAGGASMLELATRATTLFQEMIRTETDNNNNYNKRKHPDSPPRHYHQDVPVPSNLVFTPIHNLQDLYLALSTHTSKMPVLIIIDSLSNLMEMEPTSSLSSAFASSSSSPFATTSNTTTTTTTTTTTGTTSTASNPIPSIMKQLKYLTRRHQLCTVLVGGNCGGGGHATTGSRETTTTSAVCGVADVQIQLVAAAAAAAAAVSPSTTTTATATTATSSTTTRPDHVRTKRITARLLHHVGQDVVLGATNTTLGTIPPRSNTNFVVPLKLSRRGIVA
jgi:hypothetical protein